LALFFFWTFFFPVSPLLVNPAGILRNRANHPPPKKIQQLGGEQLFTFIQEKKAEILNLCTNPT
jgi:hypothetical protein